MGLKHNNPNGEIVLASKLNLVKHFFKLLKVHSKMNSISYFSRRCLDCPKNKIVHNFHIANPNGMNQSFTSRQKQDL